MTDGSMPVTRFRATARAFGCTIKNVHESLAKMASGLTPAIDTEVPLANVADALARLDHAAG